MDGKLFNAWSESRDSFFEERYLEPIIKRYVQYRDNSADKRELNARVFSNGYEIYIYAFFLGLYLGERRPLEGKKHDFRMEMFRWGRVKDRDRQPYDDIQEYIFAALIAKTDIDLISLDRGDLSIDEAVKMLMNTLSEYANAGFYEISQQIEKYDDYFMTENNFFNFFRDLTNADSLSDM